MRRGCGGRGVERMKSLRGWIWRACLLLLVAVVPACKVADDANAAAEQMTATSTELRNYYHALEKNLTDTIALNELNQSLFGLPFGEADRKQIEDARAEIRKRQQIAKALTHLSESMSAFVGSKASSDVETAATDLGNELISAKALPNGSPVPDALGKAGNFLIQIVQQHEEKKAAQAMDSTLAALVELFSKEMPVYESLSRQHIMLAKTVAGSLIKKQYVDPTPLLQPALKPFDLAPAGSDEQLQKTLRNLAESRLDNSAETANQRQAEASEAMLAALKEMSSRIHLLADEKPMPFRGNPFSLTVVESWAASII